MENALALANPAPHDPVIARHVAIATTQLLMALHYHRFFGRPIVGFSAEHNAQRAEANDRTVIAYAHAAGRYAFFAGWTLDYWIDSYPMAMCVERIREAMGQGWHATVELLHPNPAGRKFYAVIDTVATEVPS